MFVAGRRLGWCAAAHEVDYFEAIAGFEGGIWPGGAGGDGAVVFDGDAVAFQAELSDKLVEGRGIGERVEDAGMAVQDERE
jgi:hypothetical protein